MRHFVPSSASAPPSEGYGTIHSVGRDLVTYSVPAIAITQALRSKEKKWSDAKGKAERYKVKYEACAKKRKAKGKSLYPNDPGKGPFYTDCRSYHKEWKKWQLMTADYAKNLAKHLEDKDQLSKESAETLARDVAAPADLAKKELDQLMDDVKKSGGKARPPKAEKIEAAAMDPDAFMEANGGAGLPIWLLGVGALGLLGGIAFVAMRKRGSGEDEDETEE